MSDAESDGDIFHADGGMSHSRRRSCAICHEESENRRRSKLTIVERGAEDLLTGITKAISRGTLPVYLRDLAAKLHRARHTRELTHDQLAGEYQRGVKNEHERIMRRLTEAR